MPEEISRVFYVAEQSMKNEQPITDNQIESALEWLQSLRYDAENGCDWVERFRGFFNGLNATGLIGVEVIDDIDNALQPIFERMEASNHGH